MQEAVLGDVRTLVELMAGFYAESDYVLDRARADAAFRVLLSDPRLGQVWLIEQVAVTVGYVVLTFVYGMEYGGLMAFVDDFFIRPAFRNSGLGLRPWQPRVMRVRFTACAPWRSRSPTTTPPRLPYTGAPALR